MSKVNKRYAPEVGERAVRLVLDRQREHTSQWAAIESVAGKIGCSAQTLSAVERQRVKEPERENRELRRANEILRKASAFFAQAELDRRPK